MVQTIQELVTDRKDRTDTISDRTDITDRKGLVKVLMLVSFHVAQT